MGWVEGWGSQGLQGELLGQQAGVSGFASDRAA